MERTCLTRRAALGAAAAALLGPAASASPPVFGPGDGRQGLGAIWSEAVLADPDGTPFRVSRSAAPLVLVHLWAHWCPGCRTEFASLRRMASAVGARDLEVVLVSHPANWEADKAFFRRGGVPFPVRTFAAGTPGSLVNEAFSASPGGRSYAVPQSLALAGKSVLWSVVGGSDTWDSAEEIGLVEGLAARARRAA